MAHGASTSRALTNERGQLVPRRHQVRKVYLGHWRTVSLDSRGLPDSFYHRCTQPEFDSGNGGDGQNDCEGADSYNPAC